MENREEIPTAPPDAAFPVATFNPCNEIILPPTPWAGGSRLCNLRQILPRTPLMELVEEVFAPEGGTED